MEMPVNIPPSRRKAVIVGAGPVGCLAAFSLASNGWSVDIYEARPDFRTPVTSTVDSLRSINLAISARGLAALDAIHPAAAARFLESAIPMKGRMIHTRSGDQNSQPYDLHGRCINSIDRRLLNESLLQDAISSPDINVHFRHKLTTADFDKKTMSFRDIENDRDVAVSFDFCIGADGSYSNVRRQLMRCVRMDFQQTYIPHEYMELRMPPIRDSMGNTSFALDPNHLHIWPRHSFMLIALPNKDKSFTCTLFAPTSDFAALSDPDAAFVWFKSHFANAVPFIGEEAILDAFRRNPRSPLIAIKANPYHYKDRVVILGDAAHSMVPFFGQGLNCGLEDVRVLDVILKGEGVDGATTPQPADDSKGETVIDANLQRALRRYSETRHEDLVAICDLAMANYVEMRHAVATPLYLFLRALDNTFSYLTSKWQGVLTTFGPSLSRVTFPTTAPAGWIPLYTMVTFRPDISYSTAKRKAERQGRIITALGWWGASLGVLSGGIIGLKLLQRARTMIEMS